MQRFLCGFAAWSLLVGLTAPAQAQYTYTTIDVPGAIGTYAQGINASGQIVGYYEQPDRAHGFVLDVDGSYTTFDIPGATDTQAWGINDNGQVVGQAAADGRNHGFLATPVP